MVPGNKGEGSRGGKGNQEEKRDVMHRNLVNSIDVNSGDVCLKQPEFIVFHTRTGIACSYKKHGHINI